MIVYKLTSPSGKVYIGLTKNTLEKRFKQHVTLWKKFKRNGIDYRGAEGTPILFYAFDKYDPENWEKETLFETDDLDTVKQKELELIAWYQSDNQDFGYNVLLGGQTGWAGKNLSQDHKDRQSEARKAWYETEDGQEWKKHLSERWSKETNNPSTEKRGKPGRKQTDETKAKISVSNKGKLLGTTREFTEEHCNNISKGKMGYVPSQEAREKTSKTLKGHPSYETQKKAAREANSKTWDVTTPDGKTIRIINLRQFCLEHKLSQGTLKTYGHTKGFKATLVSK